MDGGTISIRIKMLGSRIEILVSNPYETPYRRLDGEGIGIKNLKQRLEVLYGNEGRLRTEKDKQTFKVRLSFPI